MEAISQGANPRSFAVRSILADTEKKKNTTAAPPVVFNENIAECHRSVPSGEESLHAASDLPCYYLMLRYLVRFTIIAVPCCARGEATYSINSGLTVVVLHITAKNSMYHDFTSFSSDP